MREDIPSKLFSKKTLNTEGVFVELTFRKKKGLLSCSYKTNMCTIKGHLEILRSNLYLHSAQYNTIIIGDFNTDLIYSCLKSFYETWTSSSLIKEPNVIRTQNILLVKIWFWQITIIAFKILVWQGLGYQIFIRWLLLSLKQPMKN